MDTSIFLASFLIGAGLIIAAICFIINHGRSQDRMLSGRIYRPEPPRTPRSGGPGTGEGAGDRTRYRPS